MRFILLLATVAALNVSARAANYIHERGGCPNAFQKFAASQKTQAYTKITFFGGSITEGAGTSKPDLCYRSLTMKFFAPDKSAAQ